MARIRTIKPDFFRHEVLYEAERETGLPLRVAFAGLWTVADREGRFRWRPRALKLDVLPFDDLDFSRVLDALTTRGFVVRYDLDGEIFGVIPSWRRHQVINNREAASDLPQPPDPPIKTDASSTREPRVSETLKSAQGEGKGREGEREQEGEGEGESRSLRSLDAREAEKQPVAKPTASDLEIPEALRRPNEADYRREFDGKFWPAYPHKVGLPTAFKAFIRARKSHDLGAILFGLDRYVNEKPADRAWLNPATFLNQERFNDAPAVVAAQRPRSGHDTLERALASVARDIEESEENDHEVKRIGAAH